MIWPFNRNTRPTEPIDATYNAIVAQSRQPKFYRDWDVPDTVTGRFDMISIHMCLVFRRLRAETGQGNPFTQDLFDLFFNDMDRSLREMGVNDVSIPKRIQKMGNIFYGLVSKMTKAIDNEDKKSLSSVIDRNLFDEEKPEAATALAGYIFEIAGALDAQAPDDIIAGKLVFGDKS